MATLLSLLLSPPGAAWRLDARPASALITVPSGTPGPRPTVRMGKYQLNSGVPAAELDHPGVVHGGFDRRARVGDHDGDAQVAP